MTDSPGTPDFLTATRTFSDTVAEDYAGHFRDTALPEPPGLDLPHTFAERAGPGAAVADLGCGPGRITGFPASPGLDASGLGLSPAMPATARREHPGPCFRQGSMPELDLPDGSPAGAVSGYSTVHTPAGLLPAPCTEFRRVPAPGGHLLLAIRAGSAPRRLDRPRGHPVTLDFLHRDPERVATLLTETDFGSVTRTVRPADEAAGETAPQAFVRARTEPGRGDTSGVSP